MKRITCSVLIALTLLLGSALPGHAWGSHGYGGRHGFGGHYGYRPYGHGYQYSSYFRPVTPQQPLVYVQERHYWYYCESARAYYPYVQQCPEAWMRVVPPTTGPGQ